MTKPSEYMISSWLSIILPWQERTSSFWSSRTVYAGLATWNIHGLWTGVTQIGKPTSESSCLQRLHHPTLYYPYALWSDIIATSVLVGHRQTVPRNEAPLHRKGLSHKRREGVTSAFSILMREPHEVLCLHIYPESWNKTSRSTPSSAGPAQDPTSFSDGSWQKSTNTFSVDWGSEEREPKSQRPFLSGGFGRSRESTMWVGPTQQNDYSDWGTWCPSAGFGETDASSVQASSIGLVVYYELDMVPG